MLLLSFTIIHAQEIKPKPNKHSIGLAYGYRLDTKWWREGIKEMNFDPPKSTSDVYLRYEYALQKKIRVGLHVVFIQVYKDGFGLFGPMCETFAYTAKAFRLLPSLHYHFLNSRKFDPYVNIGAGFHLMKTEHIYYSDDPNPLNSLSFLPVPMIRNVIKTTKTSGADFNAGIGIRYIFFNHLGLSIETGINNSVFQIALMISF